MVKIIVDALHMHPTKVGWNTLLRELEGNIGKPVEEIHTREFYAGNGPWRGLGGHKRASIIESVFGWLGERKHLIVNSAVDKTKFFVEFKKDPRF